MNKKFVPKPEVEFASSKLFFHPWQVEGMIKDDLSVPPVQLEVSLTSKCNLNCIWCTDSDWRRLHPGTLETPVLLSALKQFKDMGTKALVIEGGGEPTLHPDFREIVLEAKNMGYVLGLITNGTAFKDYDIVHNFEWIRVSLDASSEEEYTEVKNVSLFSKVLENLTMMADEKGDCVLGIGYLISTKTMGNLPWIARVCKDLGADYFQIRCLDNMEDIDVDPNIDLSDVEALSDDKFTVYTHQVLWEADDEGNYGLPCYAHALSSVLGSDGTVFFCCRLHSIESGKVSFGGIGNVYNATVQEIWNGDKRKFLANLVQSVGFCKEHCPSCRMSKFNLMIEELRKSKTRDFI